jgi:hypothetical protein
MRAEEAEKMTKRIEVPKAPAPLEEYVEHFDPLFGKSNQRNGFRRYVEGLLLPSERHKTLTGLMNTEPIVGAQLPRAQALQWFLSPADSLQQLTGDFGLFPLSIFVGETLIHRPRRLLRSLLFC